MATMRRELNNNFITWEPVETGNSRFTPCTPLDWDFEFENALEPIDAAECKWEAECRLQGASLSDVDRRALEEIDAITPSNVDLRALAARLPPPPDWPEEEGPPF